MILDLEFKTPVSISFFFFLFCFVLTFGIDSNGKSMIFQAMEEQSVSRQVYAISKMYLPGDSLTHRASGHCLPTNCGTHMEPSAMYGIHL